MSIKGENGKYYNKKQALYAKKHLAKLDEIKIRVPLGGKKEYKKIMKRFGYKSMNKFIITAVNYYIDVLMAEEES